MIVLGVDTTGPYTSLGVSKEGEILGEIEVRKRFAHSEVINLAFDSLLRLTKLRLTEIDRVAVSIGPGYFTALRVGLSFAKALNLALNIPIVAVESLYGIAFGFSPEKGTKVAPLLDAQKGEVYASLFRMEDILVKEWGPRVVSPTELSKLEGVIFIGEGAKKYGDILKLKVPYFPLFPGGGTLALLGEKVEPEESPEKLEPLYVRPPDAKLKKKG